MIRHGTEDPNPPETRLWTEMILDLTKRLRGHYWQARALASALGDVTDNAPEPQRKHYVRAVRDRLPTWLVEGLREAAR